MLKRLSKYALIPALCLLIGGLCLFAGCGKKFTVEIKWDVDLSKPIELNLIFPSTGMNNFGRDHTADIIERATGYHANYTEVSDANADNEINNLLSRQAKYHFMKVSEAQFNPYVTNKTWLDLTKLLSDTESGRKLYELIDLMPGAWDSVTYTDKDGNKGIYGIPDCGYNPIEEFALIWNTEHLTQIGWFDTHDGVPATIGEITEAMRALQSKYGTDKDYHAFGLGQNYANVENIMAAFDCPNQFYVDENGDIQFYIYNESVTNYVKYMNTLKRESILSDSWRSDSEAEMCSKFAKEKSSCVYLPYWWFTPLCKTIVSNKLAEKYGMENDYATVRDELVAYRTRVRGDGTNGSVNQEKARYISDETGCAWYTAIPYYMAEDAVYIIDYLAKKLEAFSQFYGGEENVDWEVVEAPADGKEDYANNIIYMKPWEYEYQGNTVTGGGKWVKLKQSYLDFIVDNSQYATGTNVVEARSLFHLRETGFDAWPVAVQMDKTIITNPIILKPVFDWWSPISILARTDAKQGLGVAISSSVDAEKVLNNTREGLKTTFAKRNGVKYYYWSNDIVQEMTKWYKEVKLGQH